MARDYELGLVITPDAGDDQARAIVERVTQFVGANGGQVIRVNAWGRRHMAYPIQRHRDGLYFWFDLILPPETVKELDRVLRVNEEVIRHLMKLRDPRVVQQTRQREAEADAQAAAHAAQVAAQTAQAAQAAQAAAAQATSEPPASEPSLEVPAGEPAAAAAVDEESSAEADEGDEGEGDEEETATSSAEAEA